MSAPEVILTGFCLAVVMGVGVTALIDVWWIKVERLIDRTHRDAPPPRKDQP